MMPRRYAGAFAARSAMLSHGFTPYARFAAFAAAPLTDAAAMMPAAPALMPPQCCRHY